ncbi:MAG: RdgB/HAM1 family non-canonical purine NTP pyrophosphatase [Deltaproteobacteria bacterium]|nr:RdgB/HAM1 family non-canonical purine NTP pyrophosphatase [Deltaproteobacteria bacterium]
MKPNRLNRLNRLILATQNRGKARELTALLPGIQVETLADHPELEMPEETGETFEENARQKAEHVAGVLAARAAQAASTGLPTPIVLADDSGLVVDALPGLLGVRSRRYGPGTDLDRCHKLLAALSDHPAAERRSARFVCAAALVVAGAPTIVVRGEVEGRIAEKPSGENGFGYDPIFMPIGFDSTMACLSLEEKQAISHRGRALAQLLPHIQRHFSLEPGRELSATSASSSRDGHGA